MLSPPTGPSTSHIIPYAELCADTARKVIGFDRSQPQDTAQEATRLVTHDREPQPEADPESVSEACCSFNPGRRCYVPGISSGAVALVRHACKRCFVSFWLAHLSY